jgi:rubredoxin
MELIKENYDLETIWNCPMCGAETDFDHDANDWDGTHFYFDTKCPGCGALLTLAAKVDHVCVWKETE